MNGITVIIPALNEAGNIKPLVSEVLSLDLPGCDLSVILVDNGSTDGTAEEAQAAGAQVIFEPRRGYGFACAAGVSASKTNDILVFLDGDHSSLPSELPKLLDPILSNESDFVQGSRVLGGITRGSMPFHQRFGNWLAIRMINLLYHQHLTDLGPYRAIRTDLLRQLNMQEMTYGWPTEMTVKAAIIQARMKEEPVSFHPRRIGRSKVSGSLLGSLLAAWHILGVIVRKAHISSRHVLIDQE
jgi:glycosyltransferase involved in cell wall biosynthesis